MNIENPAVFFEELGDLHDARIESIKWLKGSRELRILVDDVNSASLGLPEYGGLKRGELVFQGVRDADMEVQILTENFSIYGMKFTSADDKSAYCVELHCAPGGKIEFKCDAVDLEYQ